MSLRLRPLREDELDAYVTHGRANYARDVHENGGAPTEIAETKAKADWSRLLPDGLSSPSQFIFAVEEAETGERVGDLWFAERDTEFEGKVAFLYSIEIFEGFRGRGFGRQAMLLLEDEVRARPVADQPERLRRQRGRPLALPIARLRRERRLDGERRLGPCPTTR